MVARLISWGHSFSEIRCYTYPQIQLFLKQGAAIEADRRRAAIHDGAIAAQGTQKGIEKVLKELENG